MKSYTQQVELGKVTFIVSATETIVGVSLSATAYNMRTFATLAHIELNNFDDPKRPSVEQLRDQALAHLLRKAGAVTVDQVRENVGASV